MHEGDKITLTLGIIVFILTIACVVILILGMGSIIVGVIKALEKWAYPQ